MNGTLTLVQSGATLGHAEALVKPDPFDDALHMAGVRLERKTNVHSVTQMLAQGLGAIAGGELGGLAGFGSLGRALSALAGAIVGHVAVTYDVKLERPERGDDRGPMAVSDRR
jgi:hypothetical protein